MAIFFNHLQSSHIPMQLKVDYGFMTSLISVDKDDMTSNVQSLHVHTSHHLLQTYLELDVISLGPI